MNTSATGGPLIGTPMPDSVALRRFFQGLVVAVTGLPSEMVRPRWQRHPPPMPDFDTDWCAIGITKRTPSKQIYVKTIAKLDGTDETTVSYDEALLIAASFYGPRAEDYCEMLRDGLPIPQNREPLLIAGMGLGDIGATFNVPELINGQWEQRCDVEFTIDREVSKLYQILSFASAIGAIITETMTLPFEVEYQP